MFSYMLKQTEMALLVTEILVTSKFLLLDNLSSLAREWYQVKQKPKDISNCKK